MSQSLEKLTTEVLKLQSYWSPKNTLEMQQRGKIIRNDLRKWLEARRNELSNAMGVTGKDIAFEGRDGTGLKTQIPWVRVYSKSRSPNARNGWYCAFLFSATGSGFYLCISHGSTRWENGEFKPRPTAELKGLVEWARAIAQEDLNKIPHLSNQIALEGTTNLGPAYEQGTLASIYYPATTAVSDAQVMQDLFGFARILGKLYDANDRGMSPEAAQRDAQAFQDIVQSIIDPLKSSKGGQGFGLSAAERKVVEARAMTVGMKHLSDLGYEVRDVSKREAFDVIATKDQKSIIVEIKGTTGNAISIFLTANELDEHQTRYPENALIIVHSIELDRRTPPKASGGKIQLIFPWQIEAARLRPLSFQYTFTLSKTVK